MMRLLRMEMGGKADKAVHDYLKAHIHGAEVDDFAREIARLSLTLADIPNPNGWDLQPGDMYASDLLARETKRCRILLSNPPYERFEAGKVTQYSPTARPKSHSKAVELLNRTIPNLPQGAVFSLLLPQGVLHREDAAKVRMLLLRDFDVREICLFADRVFEEGEPESVVIIARRRRSGERAQQSIRYRRVREDGVERFARTYSPDSENEVPVSGLWLTARLNTPDLPEVWAALGDNPRLSTVADVGQGFSFEKSGLVDKARDLGGRRFSDSVRAFVDGHKHVNIWEVPPSIWLSPSRTPVSPWRSGNATGREQILVNYVRAMRGPWRIKAFLDPDGRAAINTYNTVRPKTGGPIALFLWAILNSPVANGYAYCNTMQKHNYDTLIANLPLPLRWQDSVAAINEAAARFRRVARLSSSSSKHDSDIAEALMALDAEVLRAYALPVRLERRLLDLFNTIGVSKSRRRKGVGCSFPDYYPRGFRSLVPLHKYISEQYRNSTVAAVSSRMKPGRSAAVQEALRKAAREFGQGD
jgi:hypothetical protein